MSDGDTYEDKRSERDDVLKLAERKWQEWESTIGTVLDDTSYGLGTLTVDENHPFRDTINAQRIPVIHDNQQPWFVLHDLPERNGVGYVTRKKLEQLVEKVDNKGWVILLGTSGAGKTRSVFELLCDRFGVYLTPIPPQQNVMNLGSRDLYTAIDKIDRQKNRNRPIWNSDMALTMTRAVLAGRLFVLHKLLALRNDKFTPKMWLHMQVVPGILKKNRKDLWLTMSCVFGSVRNRDLARYIDETIRAIMNIADENGSKQMKLPIVIDEIQEAVNMLTNMFGSKTSENRRSLVAILLRMACGVDVDTTNSSTVLCGTGLRYDDLLTEIGSAWEEKNIRISTNDIVCIDESFNELERMKLFVERFVGVDSFPDHKMQRIFGFLRGRFRFTVKFLESFVTINVENRRIDDLIEEAFKKTMNILIKQLTSNINKFDKTSKLWSTVEKAIIQYHIYSTPIDINECDTAFAVEVGLAQLKCIKDSADDITVISGFSEPLAVIAYLRQNKTVQTIGQYILKEMSACKWDSQHLGRLFERYLIDPLFKMFSDDKKPLYGNNLLSSVIACHDVLRQLLSCEIRIHGVDLAIFCQRPTEDPTTFESTLPNHCGHGDLVSYLRDPKEMFFFPEPSAHPDIVFIIELCHSKHEDPILVPVFIQAKLAANFDAAKALDTIRPENFYSDRRDLDVYKRKNREIQDCMESKYAEAKTVGLAYVGIVIAFPYKINRKKIDTDYKDNTLTIIVDGSNIKQLVDPKVIKVLGSLKEGKPLQKERTLDDWAVKN